MQEQPDSAELLAAVLECLRGEIIPALDGRAAFDARVAARTTSIVKREIELGPRAQQEAQERLARLLDRPGSFAALNEALCERIERGEMGLETPGLETHLWRSVLDQLAIDQPQYPGYQRALEQLGAASDSVP